MRVCVGGVQLANLSLTHSDRSKYLHAEDYMLCYWEARRLYEAEQAARVEATAQRKRARGEVRREEQQQAEQQLQQADEGQVREP